MVLDHLCRGSTLINAVMTLVALILVWCGILCVAYNFWLFDTIILAEYKHWHGQWENDGEPICLIRDFPDGVRPRNYKAAHEKLYLLWLFKTPAWALKCNKCRHLFIAYRITGILAVMAIILLGILLH